jgi:hypothetical protein
MSSPDRIALAAGALASGPTPIGMLAAVMLRWRYLPIARWLQTDPAVLWHRSVPGCYRSNSPSATSRSRVNARVPPSVETFTAAPPARLNSLAATSM